MTSSAGPRWQTLGMALDSNKKARLVVAALALQATVASVTIRDINKRPKEAVRGPKFLWRLANANTVGSIAYWLIGRKRGAALGAPVEAVPETPVEGQTQA